MLQIYLCARLHPSLVQYQSRIDPLRNDQVAKMMIWGIRVEFQHIASPCELAQG